MLVLSRREGERIMIGDDVEVMVVQIADGRVKLGVHAPADVRVYRLEVWRRRQDELRRKVAGE